GNDSVSGGDGADTLVLEDGFGTDTLTGGEGGADNDLVDLSAVSVGATVTFTGDEAGTITDGTSTASFSETERLTLTEQADLLDATADAVGTSVAAGAGNDTLTGGTGNDSLAGEDGNDNLAGDAGSDTLLGGGGDDTMSGGIGDDVLDGGDGADSLSGEQGNDTLSGGDGADLLEGGAGDNVIDGGSGNDILTATTGDDFLDGGEGADILYAELGTDTVFGGLGNDTIYVGGGSDSIDGGEGSDSIVIADSFGPNNTISGGEIGADADLIDLQYLTSGVDVTFSGGEAGTITNGADSAEFSQIELIRLTGHDDSFDGTAADAAIGAAGGAGNDSMSGGSDNDTFLGGLGDDTIAGGAGDDYIDGGDGDDVLTTGLGQDTLIGGAGNDTLMNSDGDDSLVGGAGNDSIVATGGNDTLEGGDGNDTMDGGADDDSLEGGAGDDLIEGGEGDDILSGGDGSDTFNYAPGDGNDTITDFNFGNSGSLDDGDNTNNDFIDLSAFYDDIWELHADQADDGILNQSNTTKLSGSAVDYSDNAAFDGGSIEMQGASGDNSSFTQENTGVVCFTEGTAIRTPGGDCLIEELRVGDLVTTLDNGPQRIRWIGRRRLDQQALRANPNMRPVLLRRGVLGCERDLLVSPQHGLVMGRQGDNLVRAKHLAESMRGARIANGKPEVTYIHLMFDAHEIILAENIPSESFFPGPIALKMMDNSSRVELFTLFPELCGVQDDREELQKVYGLTARAFLARKNVKSLVKQVVSV
ncbi:Hint domain-containing protein, partial [Cognatishimia sp. F0-27]|uniref:Hint domain-containing protein n=1 Tax=Cognatishimia sp. F0-27 TaxID=2816855 RepID=UPI001D0C1BF6